MSETEIAPFQTLVKIFGEQSVSQDVEMTLASESVFTGQVRGYQIRFSSLADAERAKKVFEDKVFKEERQDLLLCLEDGPPALFIPDNAFQLPDDRISGMKIDKTMHHAHESGLFPLPNVPELGPALREVFGWAQVTLAPAKTSDAESHDQWVIEAHSCFHAEAVTKVLKEQCGLEGVSQEGEKILVSGTPENNDTDRLQSLRERQQLLFSCMRRVDIHEMLEPFDTAVTKKLFEIFGNKTVRFSVTHDHVLTTSPQHAAALAAKLNELLGEDVATVARSPHGVDLPAVMIPKTISTALSAIWSRKEPLLTQEAETLRSIAGIETLIPAQDHSVMTALEAASLLELRASRAPITRGNVTYDPTTRNFTIVVGNSVGEMTQNADDLLSTLRSQVLKDKSFLADRALSGHGITLHADALRISRVGELLLKHTPELWADLKSAALQMAFGAGKVKFAEETSNFPGTGHLPKRYEVKVPEAQAMHTILDAEGGICHAIKKHTTAVRGLGVYNTMHINDSGLNNHPELVADFAARAREVQGVVAQLEKQALVREVHAELRQGGDCGYDQHIAEHLDVSVDIITALLSDMQIKGLLEIVKQSENAPPVYSLTTKGRFINDVFSALGLPGDGKEKGGRE